MRISRRTFVNSAAAGIAGAAAVRVSNAQSPAVAPSDKISLAFIGVGGMGRSNLGHFSQLPEVRVAAVCDVWDFNLQEAVKATSARPEGAAQAYKDFRQVLERKDIDAVVIATPDHWHGLITILACEAGKDVYVEKPLAHNVVEGRRMVEAARQHNRVVQLGTQQRSGVHYQEAVKLIRDGAIGTVSRVHCWNHSNDAPQGAGNWPDGNPPEGLDWDLYLGPAPKVPFNPNRFIGRFRWFWDYAGGIATDWGVHHLDIIQWAMNVEAPRAVTAAGGKFAISDNRETPDTIEVLYEYPTFVASFSSRAANARPYNDHGYGIEFYGTDATLFVDRGGFEIIPETRPEPAPELLPPHVLRMKNAAEPAQIRRARRPRTASLTASGSEQNGPHVKNFLECVKSRKRPISDVEIGHRSTTTAHLGNVALRSGRRIEWDAAAERVTNVAEANELLTRTYRAPWKLT
jgi:predicted dehydrogenase